jgi:hypothetical protein
MSVMHRRAWLGGAAAGLLAGCSSAPRTAASHDPVHRWCVPAGGVPWAAQTLPGKRHTRYEAEALGAQDWAVRAEARSSASLLRRSLRVPADELGLLRFSWRVDALIEEADLTRRETEDAPARIVLAFDGDHTRLPLRTQAMFELAATLTGERPPFATLMYVWENHHQPESVIVNPRTDRVRKLVVESGRTRLGRWNAYERQVVDDYVRAFGERPGPLLGVALMTDADNTDSEARAWYRSLHLHARDGRAL